MAYTKLTRIDGVGSFMAAQIIADLKHTPVLKRARDWWDWAAPGPGSSRGLNAVLGTDCDWRTRPVRFIELLQELRRDLRPLTPIATELCLQDLQNCLCEFFKYERGNSRSRYPGTA